MRPVCHEPAPVLSERAKESVGELFITVRWQICPPIFLVPRLLLTPLFLRTDPFSSSRNLPRLPVRHFHRMGRGIVHRVDPCLRPGHCTCGRLGTHRDIVGLAVEGAEEDWGELVGVGQAGSLEHEVWLWCGRHLGV